MFVLGWVGGQEGGQVGGGGVGQEGQEVCKNTGPVC